MTTIQDDPVGEPSSSVRFQQRTHDDTDKDPQIESILAQNRQTANDFMVSKVQREASKNWDKFYKRHQDKFFHDRHWTDREFDALKSATGEESNAGDSEELVEGSLAGHSTPVLLEVGCGVGNMLYPLLEKNEKLLVHCCDFSSRAVDIVKQHPKYTSDRINAFVYDLCSTESPTIDELISPPHSSLSALYRPTLISCIFVLSAIPPSSHLRVLQMLFNLLPPGGTLLFRDYARGDLAQLRFHKKEKWAEPSLLSDEYDYYKRGDGTMTFFFSVEYLKELSGKLESEGQESGNVAKSDVSIIERVGQNRKRDIELKRRFIQAYWTKKA